MFVARSSWHSYPYPLRGRKAEGQSTQTPEAVDLSAFSCFFQSSVGVPTESGRNSERFFRNQPTVPNQPNTTNNTNRTEPTTPTSDAQALQERRFAEFWKAYPKKVGKASCLKAWKKLKPTAELHDHIMAALEAQKRSEQWQREGGRFIPNPLTWLNQGRWDDEPTEVGGAQAPAQSGTLATLRRMYEAEGGDDE